VAAADPPPRVVALAERRAAARAAHDFATADALRDELAAAGWSVRDGPGGGYALEPRPAEAPRRVPAADVGSVLAEPAAFDATVAWVCEGWPEDVDSALATFRTHAGGRSLQYVVADVTGEPADRWGGDVEVVSLVDGTGWASARNAGLRRALGRIVLVVDGSVEPTGDVVGPLAAALADDAVGLVGPFGLVTEDLRGFRPATDPGPCDAIEAYLIACRRGLLREVGGFDERFRWYRSADLEWSFRVKDAGLRTEVVPVPVVTREHRTWAATPPDERERRSRRNFNLFLDRWRDRWDLVLAGTPDAGA